MEQKNNMLDLSKIEEIEKVPLEDRITERTTYDIIKEAAQKYPDKSALIFLPLDNILGDPTTVSYQQLFEKVNQTGNLLQELGVQSNDAVSYLLPNIAENYYLLLGAQAIGIANPINAEFSAVQIAELLKTAESKILIILDKKTNSDLWEKIKSALKIYKEIKKILVVGDNIDKMKVEIDIEMADFHQLLNEQPNKAKFCCGEERKSTICSYFHSSGTTDKPKLAQHTHWGHVHQAWLVGLWAEYDKKDAVALAGYPMFHVSGPTFSGTAAFMYGASVVVMSPFGYRDEQVTQNFWRIVNKYQGTSVSAIPHIFQKIVEQSVDNINIKSLRKAICGRSIMQEHFAQFEKLTAVKIESLWGQTESTCIGTFNLVRANHEYHTEAMGLNIPYQKMKIVLLDEQGKYVRDCQAGEEGVLCVKGVNISGYKSSELNKRFFLLDGWFNTGDLASQDENGCYWFKSRVTDFIYSGKERISLIELEEEVITYFSGGKVAAICVPDGTRGEKLVVYVMTKNSMLPSLLKEGLKSKEKFSTSSIIDSMEIVLRVNLPLSTMGKVIKSELKDDYIKNNMRPFDENPHSCVPPTSVRKNPS